VALIGTEADIAADIDGLFAAGAAAIVPAPEDLEGLISRGLLLSAGLSQRRRAADLTGEDHVGFA
jgi:hypothetical protein